MDTGGGNTGSPDATKTSSNSTGETSQHSGCGCASGTSITVRVTPTTGGQFDLQVARTESVENLKKLISKKLKVPKERICLLHRDRQLRDGTLQENQLMDGSRLTLLPSVETGLLAQRPEQSVMQALESLNDSQVNDFLSGKAPLNLTMRLGDHMMLIQLQLSTVTPSSSRRSATTNTTTLLPTPSSSSQPQTPSTISILPATTSNNNSNSSSNNNNPLRASESQEASCTTSSPSPKISHKSPCHSSTDSSSQRHHQKSPSPSTSSTCFQFPRPFPSFYSKSSSTSTSTSSSTSTSTSSSTSTSTSSSTISTSSTTSSSSSSPSSSEAKPAQSPLKSLENATNNLNVYARNSAPASQPTETTTSTTTTTSSSTVTSHFVSSSHSCSSGSSSSSSSTSSCKCEPTSSTTAAKPTLDTRALAEASRNLTQTLKQLSSEVLTSRSDPAEDNARARRQGAIIESMHHHGKGVYSGTFSGTLNPALQDRFGRPKRDISTIIHILNDLLCATPQYRRHARQGHTITVEASSGNPAKSGTTGTSGPVSGDRAGQGMEFSEESVTLSRENQATRGKMEQLRLIMEERRARRRARREARSAPYTLTQWSAKSESLPTQNAAGAGAGPLGTHGDEPMDTAASAAGEQQHVCELNPPEPVVA